ncbi:Protein BRANCHLESS TRICHOME [Abeliophyllum distichum]|uniref:Protein BRANCHLESS TRICHOME n=1 Tax=Abeliophyllum distichum TaxID=126358 RepID=A0ABD1TV94_9LAMI
MMVRSQENSCNNQSIPNVPITTSTSPTWKLYENPFYISQNNIQQKQLIHRLHLPISARKIAASFWDLNFIKPFVEFELKMARAKIIELKAELECERQKSKKVESLNKRLAKELFKEKKGRESLERICKKLSVDKAKADRMKKEMEEERKMLRTAEVIREERVQMKLAEAKLLLEEKMLELTDAKNIQRESSISMEEEDHGRRNNTASNAADCASVGQNIRFVMAEKPSFGVHSMAMKRRATPEPENPHIKRGIKGFVEFPKVVRAIGCRRKDFGSKLECQKAQLKILLKQKGPVQLDFLTAS